MFCSHLPSVTIFSILGHFHSSGCIIVSLVFFYHNKLIFCSHLQSVTIFSILGHSWPFLAVLVSSGFIIVSLMFFILPNLYFVVIYNLWQSSPFLAILVSSGFLIVSWVFFYLTKLLLWSHLQSVTIFSILNHSCSLKFLICYCLFGVSLSYRTSLYFVDNYTTY